MVFPALDTGHHIYGLFRPQVLSRKLTHYKWLIILVTIAGQQKISIDSLHLPEKIWAKMFALSASHRPDETRILLTKDTSRLLTARCLGHERFMSVTCQISPCTFALNVSSSRLTDRAN